MHQRHRGSPPPPQRQRTPFRPPNRPNGDGTHNNTNGGLEHNGRALRNTLPGYSGAPTDLSNGQKHATSHVNGHVNVRAEAYDVSGHQYYQYNQELSNMRQEFSATGLESVEEIILSNDQAKAEEALLDSQISNAIKAIAAEPMPPRPGYGAEGRTISVDTNHYVMKHPRYKVHHFDAAIASTGNSKRQLPIKVNRLVMSALAAQERWNPDWIYDGKKNLYILDPPYPPHKGSGQTFEVELLDNDRTDTFEVVVTWANAVDLGELRKWVGGEEIADGSKALEAITALDIALRQSKVDDPNCMAIGRGFYYPAEQTRNPLGGGVELWRGWLQSVRPADGGLTVNVDVAHAAVDQEQPVPMYLCHKLNIRDSELGCLSSSQIRRAKAEIYHKKVEPKHLTATVKTAIGLTKEGADRLTFRTPQVTAVADYYRTKRNILLKHPDWPCLDVGRPGAPSWIPIELLWIVPGQRAAQLEAQQKAAMIKSTAQPPQQRKLAIQSAVEQASLANDPTGQAFRLAIKSQMIRIGSARVLDAPEVEYGRGQGFCPSRGSWDLRRREFFHPAALYSFGVACIREPHPGLAQDLQIFMKHQIGELRKYGLNTPHPGKVPSIAFNRLDPTAALQRAFQLGQDYFQARPDILFVLLMDTSPEAYKAVKRASDGVIGVPSQCFVAEKAGIGRSMPQGKLAQYMGNLAMKINSKLGGINQIVPDSLPWKDEPVMILGADVTHPAPGADEPSIAAVTGSMDVTNAAFTARIQLQPPRTEIIADMGTMTRDLLKVYKKMTGQIPTRLIMFRDGVSEGQFQQVKRREVAAILHACSSLPNATATGPYQPLLTYLVVQKRHHTRFFPVNQNDGDAKGNPLPGTVVDKYITRPGEFSYFLNSHAGLQGTSCPCLYHVLIDQNEFGMDELQRLTNNLCYQFQRATKAVSLVPPAYYADLAAERGRCMVSQVLSSSECSRPSRPGNMKVEWVEINESLLDKFFFI